jgi:hypothetical protein
MIPSGMLTVPEVLELIRARIDDDDLRMQTNPKPDKQMVACESLAQAIRNGLVAAYIMSGGAVQRIERTFDGNEPEQLIAGWETWLASGRVNNGSKYNGTLLYLRPYNLEMWLGPEPKIVSARTGTQGRPTKSWPVIEREFHRRRSEGKTAASREGEAKALVAWLKDTHPTAERPTAKTVQNNLPADFQPRGNAHPK